MNLTDIIEQLGSLKRSSEAFADADPEDELWAADIAALNGSTEILTVLRDAKIGTADDLKDVLEDYRQQADQLRELQRKFTKAAKPTRKGDIWACPECGHRITPNHGFCHWCGKKLGGW